MRMKRYRTLVYDSARWRQFELHGGDIIISTPPKCGTTWTQMLCALLIFDGPKFPAALEQLSPWVDSLSRSMDDIRATYAAQEHRRFIKTHTPLDGLPERDDVTYVVVGRDPRDVAVSMEHHLANFDLDRFLQLREKAVGLDDLSSLPSRPLPSDDPRQRFRTFVTVDDLGGPATLASVLHHLTSGWERRRAPNVAMFHYADYVHDLPGEMVRLAGALGMELAPDRAVELAPEASLTSMRERAGDVVPSASQGVFRSIDAFLRAGSTGEWKDRVTEADIAIYDARVAELVPPELARWAHRGRIASGIEP
jgi:hypothetical protein